MRTLSDILDERTGRGELREILDGGWVRCRACAHRCLMAEGARGACRVRRNRGGELYVPFGYVSGAQCDPIEKKPFFHVRPGALAYSFGMLGCNLCCDYCQNWITSQALRDSGSAVFPQEATAGGLVAAALDGGAGIVVSTYNEPLITGEWAAAVFREARAAGLLTGYVSNGFATPEAWDYIGPWLDLCKIDLKTFDESGYRRLGGGLEPVLDSIRTLFRRGVWVEVVTLLVPGFNDSDPQLRGMAEFIAGVSPDIPWHVTAFHPDYRMTDSRRTTPADFVRAAGIGRASGLRYVYAGNLPGRLGEWENTRCPGCGRLLIERRGYRITGRTLSAEGRCPSCGRAVPGRWREGTGPQP